MRGFVRPRLIHSRDRRPIREFRVTAKPVGNRYGWRAFLAVLGFRLNAKAAVSSRASQGAHRIGTGLSAGIASGTRRRMLRDARRGLGTVIAVMSRLFKRSVAR